jgi:hypothetical protein
MNVLRQNVALGKFYSSNDEWQGSRPCHFKPVGIKIISKLNHEPKLDGGRKHYYINKESNYDHSYKPGKKIFNDRYSPEPSIEKEISALKKIIPIHSEPKVYHSRIISNPYKLGNRNNYRINITHNDKKKDNCNISIRNGMEIVGSEKVYKNIDCSDDLGEGSNNTINYNKYSNNKGLNILDFTMNILTNNSYKVREQLINDRYDRQYVSNLDKFEMRLNKK